MRDLQNFVLNLLFLFINIHHYIFNDSDITYKKVRIYIQNRKSKKTRYALSFNLRQLFCNYFITNSFKYTSFPPYHQCLLTGLIQITALALYIEVGASGTFELSITAEKYTYRVAEPQYAAKFGI